MRVTLEVTGGPYAGKRIVLSRGQSATFGRTPQADYQFPRDPLMSSRHFAVEVDGQGCRVRDLESRNGTYVDDKRIVARNADSGSVILAGDTKFSVTVAEAAPLSPLPPLPVASLPATSPPGASLPGASLPSPSLPGASPPGASLPL